MRLITKPHKRSGKDMSVIRRPGVLGRNTQRRVLGMTAAVSAAAIEAVAVGAWFVLVVVESRTLETALAGLGILFCGALLRTFVFGAATSSLYDVFTPLRIGAALLATASWIVWLLVAEGVGGTTGLVAGASALTVALAVQFRVEHRVFDVYTARRSVLSALLPATLVAVGVTTLLSSKWFTDWAATTDPIALGTTTVILQIEAFQIGLIVFAFLTPIMFVFVPAFESLVMWHDASQLFFTLAVSVAATWISYVA